MQDLGGPCVLASAGAPCPQAEDQGARSLRTASPAGHGARGSGQPAHRDLELPRSYLAGRTLGYYHRHVTESTGTDCRGQEGEIRKLKERWGRNNYKYCHLPLDIHAGIPFWVIGCEAVREIVVL